MQVSEWVRNCCLIQNEQFSTYITDFLDRGLLLAIKLLYQGILLVKLKSLPRRFTVATMTWLTVTTEYLCHKWPWIYSVNRNHYPHSWLITGFVTRLTRRVPLVEQELLTLPEHLSSSPVLVVRVAQSLVFCVMCCISLFVLLSFFLCCLFFFDLRLLITAMVSSFSYDKRNYFNFPIVNVPFIYNNISAAHAYWLYIFFR